MDIYDPKTIEPKWSKFWLEKKVYQPDLIAAKKPLDKTRGKPYYNLMMFPYPSAEGLHVGNMYAFTGADVYGRFKRMQGFDVFQPIGLDGFGIHSENYAIKVGRHPKDHAKISEKHFYQQLHMIGNGFAWDQKLETYDPEYYRWTQWIFVQMYKNNLAYRKKAMVNWCPSCKTVLSDEQVEGGVCERCKTPTTRKETEQWFFKITAYADQLLNNIPKLNWPKKITTAQQNWIGKKEGINIDYSVKGADETVTCFTTAPVNFGMTFIVISPEHSLVSKILDGKIKVSADILKGVKKYVELSKHKTEQQRQSTEKEKTGVFSGLHAINHVAGWEVPIWLADFVLKDVGTGAVQGCPGHDRKDFEFAKKHGLPIIRVVVGPDGDTSEIDTVKKVIVSGMPGTMVNSKFLDGMEFSEALQKTMDYIEKNGKGKRIVNYHLRDWLISRQRYWGPPIPMIFCASCAENQRLRAKGQGLKEENRMLGWYPVPEDQLPVLLPDIEDFKPTGDGLSPLQKAPKSWLETVCPKCGGKAKRETDVSDTFLDSSWYFLAYPNLQSAEWSRKRLNDSNHLTLSPFNQELTKKWLPVNVYIGGAEHAVLHLLYARFVWMCFKDWGYLPGIDSSEPFPFLFSHGLIIKDGVKMSKSRGNVVTPDEYIGRYGADALRMYLMFLGPYDQGGDFRDTGMAGMYRFLERVWKKFQNSDFPARSGYAAGVAGGRIQISEKEIGRELNKTIKKVTEDIAKLKYNTGIASLMEFMNEWEGKGKREEGRRKREKFENSLSKEDAAKLIKLFAPFAPYVAEEIWHRLYPNSTESIHLSAWPEFDPKILEGEQVEIPVQVNGKTRAVISVDPSRAQSQSDVEKMAMEDSSILRYIGGKKINKIIFVSGKIINLIVS